MPTREARVDANFPDNVILLGHRRANPWVELFESRMNFRHRYDDTVRQAMILNTAPLPGEKSSYVTDNTDQGYAVTACLPGPGNRGTVVVLFGIHLAEIDGGAQLLIDEQSMMQLHSLLGVRLSDPMPYFEALLEKKPGAPKYEIIAHRVIKKP